MNSIDSTRRKLIKNLLIGTAGMTLVNLPGLLWANIPSQKRLLVIVLRGAMDGLGVVPPIGDPNYQQARGALAFSDSGLLPLNNFFSLNDALSSFHPLFKNGELLILHATATPYRERSHFDGQDLLENGSTKPHYLKTGWLGRVIDSFNGTTKGLAIGPNVPLLLQAQTTVESWSPSILAPADFDFMTRISRMYAVDPLLSKVVQPILSEVDNAATLSTNESARRQQFTNMMEMTAKFMSQANGPNIAAIDIGGWDTHAGQGLNQGRLAQALKNLSAGVDIFKQGMTSLWDQTAVLAVTEFGRTVMANGSGGSDHGTGTAAFLLGGNVQGGQIIGDWPGLAKNALYQERDLFPANDLRCLLKAVLIDHLGMSENSVEQTIFPDSLSAKPYSKLFRKT